MYNNESAGPALEEFLNLLGERVRLKGFTKYRAQLDTKSMCTLIPTLNLQHYPQAKNSSHLRNSFQVNKDRIFNNASQIMVIVPHHLCINIYSTSAGALPSGIHHELALIHCIFMSPPTHYTLFCQVSCNQDTSLALNVFQMNSWLYTQWQLQSYGMWIQPNLLFHLHCSFWKNQTLSKLVAFAEVRDSIQVFSPQLPGKVSGLHVGKERQNTMLQTLPLTLRCPENVKFKTSLTIPQIMHSTILSLF